MDLKQEHDGSVLKWTLSRSQRRNALGDQVFQEMDKALSKIETQCAEWLKAPRKKKIPAQVLIIDAETDGSEKPIWIAGGDLTEHAAKNAEQGKIYAQNYTEICMRLEQVPIPVLMKMHGAVLGGGIEFALSGDLRFATEQSYFDFRQVQVGLATGYGGAKRLAESVGRSLASYWLLTSQKISAEQAHKLGLIHELAPDLQSLDQLLKKHLEKLCALEPLSLAAQKKMLSYASHALAQPNLELKLFEELWKNDTHLSKLTKFSK